MHLKVAKLSYIIRGDFFNCQISCSIGMLLNHIPYSYNTARMMLSSLNSDELIRAVVKEDVGAIKAVKGIGIKTAQRVIIDLKDTFSKFEVADVGVQSNNKNKEEALLALQTLGFNKVLIEKALDKILKEKSDYGVEELIRLALKIL